MIRDRHVRAPIIAVIITVAKIKIVITMDITRLIVMGTVVLVHVLKIVMVIHLLSEVCLSRHRFIAFLVNRFV